MNRVGTIDRKDLQIIEALRRGGIPKHLRDESQRSMPQKAKSNSCTKMRSMSCRNI